MVDRDSAAPLQAPFDQGVFLLHYNRGREAFQEGRFAEARRDLEHAQKLRPDDSDVLNLLGLVYFKANAFPEAEVIYRRLAKENPNVFILHSNLGLILFKQGKLEDAEEFLLRSVELREVASVSRTALSSAPQIRTGARASQIRRGRQARSRSRGRGEAGRGERSPRCCQG